MSSGGCSRFLRYPVAPVLCLLVLEAAELLTKFSWQGWLYDHFVFMDDDVVAPIAGKANVKVYEREFLRAFEPAVGNWSCTLSSSSGMKSVSHTLLREIGLPEYLLSERDLHARTNLDPLPTATDHLDFMVLAEVSPCHGGHMSLRGGSIPRNRLLPRLSIRRSA